MDQDYDNNIHYQQYQPLLSQHQDPATGYPVFPYQTYYVLQPPLHQNHQFYQQNPIYQQQCVTQSTTDGRRRRLGKEGRKNSGSPAVVAETTQTICRCLIDLSTPATLERDFYAWLKGQPSSSRSTMCLFSNRPHPSATLTVLEYGVSVPTSTNTSPSSLSLAPDSSTSPTSHHSSTSSDGTSTSTSSLLVPSMADGAKPRARRKRNVDKASGRGTNLYGRPYCPGRPLSMEERAQIINLFHAGMKVNAISKQLCISHGCVSKIITRFRETGLLMPSSHAECRRRRRQQMQLQENG